MNGPARVLRDSIQSLRGAAMVNVYVMPCIASADGVVTPAGESAVPQFWGVYVRLDDGTSIWRADHVTAAAATSAAHVLAKALELPVDEASLAIAARRAEAPRQYRYIVVVECETEAQATRVMAERIYHDEDYGFDYTIYSMPEGDE